MTEKLLTFPSPTPLSYLPRPWGWVLRSKFNFFQYSINTTKHQQRYLYRDTMGGSRNFLSGGWVGVGVQAPQLILQFKEGVQWFYYTFSRGGRGPTFSRGGGPIETHITITCDFPGGPDPLSPLWIRTWTLWHFGTNRLRRACAASF